VRCLAPRKVWRVNEPNPKTGKSKISFKPLRDKSSVAEELLLPCGMCKVCLLGKARDWSIRCYHEAFMYQKNCFITLTYNNEKLPFNGSLRKDHFQNFMKRLRKKFKQRTIRYFMCGEYGKKLSRPHYHALLFNFDFEDKEVFKVTQTGSLIYRSKTLEKLWQDGYSSIGSITKKSAGYVARYTMKKYKGSSLSKDIYYDSKTPEYSTMSKGKKKDGTSWIGREFIDKYGLSDVYNNDIIIIENQVAGKPPKRYDIHLELTNPELYAYNKKKRKEVVFGVKPYYHTKDIKYAEQYVESITKQLKRGVEDET